MFGICPSFKGHFLSRRAQPLHYDSQLVSSLQVLPIRESLKAQADEYRAKMIEIAVEQDDAAMEAYLEGEEPDIPTLKALIRKGTLKRDFMPMICGSAFKNKGVQPLLDAIVDYLPAPTDLPDMKVRSKPLARELGRSLRSSSTSTPTSRDREI